ncbi:MAG: DUF3108 domain-containing protein, partial [Deltaproteobacteria bacterium]|nr:DUF3108 domain-containing protein [Deltaproteobacteria bacterium]
IYKVRDRIDSYVNREMKGSLLYKEKKLGHSEKDVIIQFDQERLLVQYSNFGESIDPVKIEPGSFDPLSVFFAFRLYDPGLHKEIRIPVSDGKKSAIGKAVVIKREKIEVSGIPYDTFLVEPDLEHLGGVFQKSPGAKLQIWVTADPRRIPVRIKSNVSVGSFVAELVSYEAGK